MKRYVPTIGLEIHAELKTSTKMFCQSKNDTRETRANVNVCPVCMAHPGTLPVINREAVRHVLRVGSAAGGALADYTEFDRKNYFYPDLPKGYQISQYEHPLVSGGEIAGVALTRIHLEEDTASSVHDDEHGETLIDYNRAGVPLMELVTEPVMHSAEEAGAFARELQLLLRYLGASDADMEHGEMRVEANVSVAPEGERAEAYVEIKNLNSFRAMERAVQYEIGRQRELLERGERVTKQTLGWDEAKQRTFPQRDKEGSADYRYFPDPDLPPLTLSIEEDFRAGAIRGGLPELPAEKRSRYIDLGVKAEDAEQYVRDPALGSFFDAVAELLEGKDMILLASNYAANDLVKLIRDTDDRDSGDQSEIMPNPQKFASLIKLAAEGKVSSRGAKDILVKMMESGEAPDYIAEREGLYQKSGADELLPVIQRVLAEHESVVNDYRAGKEQALMFLIGKCMAEAKGAADPQALRELIKAEIAK